MPKYVVISNHPPNSCPSANKALKAATENMDKDLEPLMKKYGIKPDVVLHLDPGHKIVWVMEAPTAESVRDFVYAAGLSRWNDFEFYMASSMEEVMSWTEKLPTIW